MRRIFVAAWAVMLCASAFSATVFYVDPAGKDTNAGTSTSAAWKTLSNLNSRTFSAGDTILLKSGGVWREQLKCTSSGTAAAPITFGAYGTGAKPKIMGTSLMTGFASYQTNVYRVSVPRKANVVYFGDIRGIEAPDTAHLLAPYQYYCSSAYLFVYSVGNPTSVYPSVEASTYFREYCIDTNSKNYLVFDGLELGRADYITFTVYGGTGITVKNCDIHASRYNWPNLRVAAHSVNVTIDNCTFGRPADVGYSGKRLADFGSVGTVGSGGGWTVKNSRFYWTTENDTGLAGNDHGIAIVNAAVGNVLVDNCQVYDVEDSGIYISTNDTQGTITVQNCHVLRAGNAGIHTWNQKGSLAGPITIKNNRVEGCAYRHNDAVGIHINSTWNPTTVEHNEVWNCRNLLPNVEDGGGIAIDADGRNTVVRYNLLHDNYGKGIYVFAIGGNSRDHKIYGNVIYNNDSGILVSGSDGIVSNVQVYNNTCYKNYNGSGKGPGYDSEIVFGPNAQQLLFRNNVLYAHDSGYCFRRFNVNVSGIDSNYNCMNKDNGGAIGIDNDGGARTLTTWRAYGYDLLSDVHDPHFVNALARDFHLLPESACIDQGVPMAMTVDYAGVVVPQGMAPDRGAYEALVSGLATATPTPTPTRTNTPASTATPTSTPTPTPISAPVATNTPPPTATATATPTAAAAGGWATLWSAAGQTAAQSSRNSLADRNYRNWIKGGQISGSATTIRLRLRGGDGTAGTFVDAVSIGKKQASSDAYDYSATPVRATFGGSPSVALPQNGVVVSDPIALAFTPGVDYLVAVYCAGQELIAQWTQSGASNSYYRMAAADDSLVADTWGYTAGASVYILDGIEGGMAAATTDTPTPSPTPTRTATATPTAAPAAPSGEWVVLWSAGEQTGGALPRLNSLSDRNYRNWIKGQNITGAAGLVRVRLRGSGGSRDTVVDAASFGRCSITGDLWDFDAPPVPLTFAGSTTAVVPALGSLASDPVAFAVQPGQDYLVALFHAGNELVSFWSQGTGTNSHYRSTVTDESALENVSGYYPTATIYIVEAIEGYVENPGTPQSEDVWSVLWTAAEQTGAETVGLNSLTDRNYRDWIKGAHLDGGASWVRLVLRAGSQISPTHIDAAAIGPKAPGSADFAAEPVVVTFGGQRSATIPPGGTIQSDPVNFPVVVGVDYLVSLYLEGSELVSLWSESGGSNSFSRTIASDETLLPAAAGYATLSSLYLLEALEGSEHP